MDVKCLPQMADEAKPQYLFVAIDRATRWVYLEVKEDKDRPERQRLPEKPLPGLPNAHPEEPDGQRAGIHRLLALPRQTGQRPA
jgi:hypothetical protein